MKIVYTLHLKKRLKERKFPYNYPKAIYNKAEARYCDNLNGSYIAIKKLPYGGKSRKISIAYIYDSSYVKIKTIHPENDREISNRVKNGRWIKI